MMKRFFASIFVAQLICSAITVVIPERALAQKEGLQAGKIELETAPEKKSNYKISQQKAIAFFTAVDKATRTLPKGSTVKIPPFEQRIANYLTGVYLYCVSKNGVCPLVLDAILETDIMNGKISGKRDQCPNMRSFWKEWVRNGFEERQKYMLTPGYFVKTIDFNENQRPRYLQCKKTVKAELEGTQSNAEFFKERYAPGQKSAVHTLKMKKFLQKLEAKVPNVFIAVGAKSSGVQPSIVLDGEP